MSEKKYPEIPQYDSRVSEPMVAYLTTHQLSKPLYGLLGAAFAKTSSSDLDLLRFARQGFKKQALVAMAKKISITLQELAGIMHISERTLQRYDDDEIIKAEYAEKAVELARLYTRGEEVLGSLDRFKIWMKSPLHVFNGDTPVSLLDTSVGFNILFNELGRIEHGIFA